MMHVLSSNANRENDDTEGFHTDGITEMNMVLGWRTGLEGYQEIIRLLHIMQGRYDLNHYVAY